jgi:hypothetical protein
MATKDLITLNRSKQSIQAITDSSQDTLLGVLITAISDAIEKYCRRRFISTAYDEIYNGEGERRLLLRQYPIQSVQSVRYRPVTVLKVMNVLPATNQQARVSVTSVGLKLFRMASGVSSTDTTCTWASNPTLNALANAVNTLGHGWSAQIVGDAGQIPGQQGDYGLWPSSDLFWPNSYGDPLDNPSGILESQGALDARNNFAELKMHTYELQGYQWDPRGWLLRAIPYTDPELMHPEDLIFPVGINNFRVQYTAGYTTIPEAVQEACAEWVNLTWYKTSRDTGLSAVAVSGAYSETWAQLGMDPGKPPPTVTKFLAPYRRYSVGINQG